MRHFQVTIYCPPNFVAPLIVFHVRQSSTVSVLVSIGVGLGCWILYKLFQVSSHLEQANQQPESRDPRDKERASKEPKSTMGGSPSVQEGGCPRPGDAFALKHACGYATAAEMPETPPARVTTSFVNKPIRIADSPERGRGREREESGSLGANFSPKSVRERFEKLLGDSCDVECVSVDTSEDVEAIAAQLDDEHSLRGNFSPHSLTDRVLRAFGDAAAAGHGDSDFERNSKGTMTDPLADDEVFSPEPFPAYRSAPGRTRRLASDPMLDSYYERKMSDLESTGITTPESADLSEINDTGKGLQCVQKELDELKKEFSSICSVLTHLNAPSAQNRVRMYTSLEDMLDWKMESALSDEEDVSMASVANEAEAAAPVAAPELLKVQRGGGTKRQAKNLARRQRRLKQHLAKNHLTTEYEITSDSEFYSPLNSPRLGRRALSSGRHSDVYFDSGSSSSKVSSVNSSSPVPNELDSSTGNYPCSTSTFTHESGRSNPTSSANDSPIHVVKKRDTAVAYLPHPDEESAALSDLEEVVLTVTADISPSQPAADAATARRVSGKQRIWKDSGLESLSTSKCTVESDTPDEWSEDANISVVYWDVIKFFESRLNVWPHVADNCHFVLSRTCCQRMRLIKADRHRLLRSVLFQVMNKRCYGAFKGKLQSAVEHMQPLFVQFPFLNEWRRSRTKSSSASWSEMTMHCRSSLSLIDLLETRTQPSSVEDTVLSHLNNAEFDRSLTDSVRLVMLLELMRLTEQSEAGYGVPPFLHQLVSRHSESSASSTRREDVFLHFLSQLDSAAELDWMELSLLGHALEVFVRLLRLDADPSDEHRILFVPDGVDSEWPTVDVLSEDNSNYYVLVP